MKNMLSVDDKIIIVFGGCGNLGATINKHFLSLGAKVICVDKINPEDVYHDVACTDFYQSDIT